MQLAYMVGADLQGDLHGVVTATIGHRWVRLDSLTKAMEALMPRWGCVAFGVRRRLVCSFSPFNLFATSHLNSLEKVHLSRAVMRTG